MLQQLVLDSAGAAIGVFVGVLIGLGVRKRKGNTEGLLGGSVLLTASAAAGVALLVMMAYRYFLG
ncbi:MULTISPECIES: hypothetical protein [Roseobacteraceae]|uniref:hypothetical protein n=1 Tax=Roseobacteraceae TaxID=2854170 RepID=UPI0013BA0CAA|nr:MULTISPECIES: hypothetical protein [unclassified Salipiger]NDV50971.1 hypothetical protein [Salipiger sp. PrR003]NDW33973.1 hypothetical protein [Salipiger sp. PrR007]